jgi:thiamine pyrophosphate-dependent acetolactate synthase large subunit-like protein
MNLGSLITVAGAGATNLTVVVLDNGLYEVTGGQKTPAAQQAVDFAALAAAARFPTARQYGDRDTWRRDAAALLTAPGPRFIALAVQPAPKEFLAHATPPLAEQLARLAGALRAAV